MSGGKLAKKPLSMGLFCLAHFVKPGTLNKTPIDLKNLNLRSNLSKDDFLAAEIRAASINININKRINSFSVSHFKVMEF